MNDLEKIFKMWIEDSIKDEKIKDYLYEQKQSYYSFLIFFLKNTIHKK